MYYKDIKELIGGTPLLEISGLEGQKARIALKLECFNPGGSVKDRTALSMIEDAEARGVLKPGATIIEPTSGNTGVGLAWIGAVKGYKTIIVMPDTMSVERRSLLKAFGAQLELTPGAEGIQACIKRAEELREMIPSSFIPGQFENPANPAIHERTTSEEIWADTCGAVDIFVAGVGTGGTFSGTAKGLKKHNPAICAVAVEPYNSAVLSGGKPGKHGLQGIGGGFIPETCDGSMIDKTFKVTDSEAFAAVRLLARTQGLLVGISSGAAFHAAAELSRLEENRGKLIVALMPDTGERYLSTGIFD